jgi:hypothetical protein
MPGPARSAGALADVYGNKFSEIQNYVYYIYMIDEKHYHTVLYRTWVLYT